MGIWASQLPATKQKEENMDTQFLVRKKKGGATSQDGLTNLVNQPEFLIYVSGTCECPLFWNFNSPRIRLENKASKPGLTLLQVILDGWKQVP